MSFFPEYEEYRKHTHILIPFIPVTKSQWFVCYKSDWLNSITGNIIYLSTSMGLFGKVKTAKKVMDTIPQVDSPWNIILFIVNIILPGTE